MLTLAVGIAAIDLGNNRMVLTQVADQKTYGCTLSTLLQLDPTQIVISARASSSKLALTLGATGYTEILTEIERKYFSVTEGQCMLESSAAVLDGVTLKELENKYLATAAAFAVYKYGAWYAAVVFVPRAKAPARAVAAKPKQSTQTTAEPLPSRLHPEGPAVVHEGQVPGSFEPHVRPRPRTL